MNRRKQWTLREVAAVITRLTRDRNGIPPTIREIRDGMGAGSLVTALTYINALEAEGMIRRWPGARGIRVLRGRR